MRDPGSPRELPNRLFSCRDLDDARERISSIFVPHDQRVLGAERAGLAEMAGLHLPGVSLYRLRYGAPVEIEAAPMQGFYLVELPLRGLAQVRCGPHRYDIQPGSGAIVSPLWPMHKTFSVDCDQLLLKLDRTLVERAARRWHGERAQAALLFRPGFDDGSPQAGNWLRLVNYVLQQADADPQLFAQGPWADRLTEMFVTLLLTQHALDEDDETSASAALRGLSPRFVVRTCDYIDAHLAEELTLPDLARMAEVSVRTLTAGFRRYRDMSPMQYVRERRLQAVHRDLSLGAEASVTDAAMRHGFVHLGRFSALYKARFHESPSQSVRRARHAALRD